MCCRQESWFVEKLWVSQTSPGKMSLTKAQAEELKRLAMNEIYSDDPLSKITDWVSGYLPAMARDLNIDFQNTNNNEERRVLDFGCGKGGIAMYMAAKLGVGHVVGVDIDKERIDIACDRFKAIPEDCLSFKTIEPSKPYPFEDGQFDGIICAFVLTIISRKEVLHAAKEMKRMLQPGGVAVSLVNNPDAFGTRFTSIGTEKAESYEQDKLYGLYFYKAVKSDEGKEAEVEDKPFLEGADVWRGCDWYRDVFAEAGFDNIDLIKEPYDEQFDAQVEDLGIPPSVINESERKIGAALAIVVKA